MIAARFADGYTLVEVRVRDDIYGRWGGGEEWTLLARHPTHGGIYARVVLPRDELVRADDLRRYRRRRRHELFTQLRSLAQ